MNDEKMAETVVFPEENNECLPNFEVFNENEILETSNDLDDSEISLFIEENRNVNTTKKTKTDLKSVKETRAIEEIPAPRNLTIFYVICLSKLGKGTHLFSGAVFNKCTIVVGQKSPPLISSKTTRGY